MHALSRPLTQALQTLHAVLRSLRLRSRIDVIPAGRNDENRHSIRERQIVQLSYPMQSVDNHGIRQGTTCARILDNPRAGRTPENRSPGLTAAMHARSA